MHPASRPGAASLLLLFWIAACGERIPDEDVASSAEDSDGPRSALATESTIYTLRRDAPGWTTNISFTYRAGADTVYVVNCNGAILMNLQKLEGGDWIDAWYAEGNQCLSPPIIIPPGEVFRGQATVWGAEPRNPSYNSFRVADIDGEYRIVWSQPVHHYQPGPGSFGDTLPLTERVSNSFTLERDTDSGAVSPYN